MSEKRSTTQPVSISDVQRSDADTPIWVKPAREEYVQVVTHDEEDDDDLTLAVENKTETLTTECACTCYYCNRHNHRFCVRYCTEERSISNLSTKTHRPVTPPPLDLRAPRSPTPEPLTTALSAPFMIPTTRIIIKNILMNDWYDNRRTSPRPMFGDRSYGFDWTMFSDALVITVPGYHTRTRMELVFKFEFNFYRSFGPTKEAISEALVAHMFSNNRDDWVYCV